MSNNHSIANQNFRSDINGLRAWAVVAVVFYHFNIPGFSGGFVGVDVFFVISGFLMTGIIEKGIRLNQFSLFSFYFSRARRILPALLVLCIFVLVFGWFYLMPEEYKTLGKHVRDSLLFSSNLRYMAESGYFDISAHEKWLLHTWSLSVEWQFYLALPLLVMVVWRLRPRRSAIFSAHVVLLLLSFVFCLHLTDVQPTKAFYLFPSRAWELLLGGVVAMSGLRQCLSVQARRMLVTIGLLCIAGSTTYLDASDKWPGWLALLPAIGTALVLVANRESIFTSARALQWLGTRSYSIYLWHWPLVVLLAYFQQSENVILIVSALWFTVLLGQLSYACVEVPARNGFTRQGARWEAACLAGCLIVVVVIAQQIRHSGVSERLPSAVTEVELQRLDFNPRREECLSADAACVYGGQQIAALVLGDSHADAVVGAVQASLPDSKLGVLFRGVSSCLLVFSAKQSFEPRPECDRLKSDLDSSLDTLHAGLPIILINRTPVFAFGEFAGPGVKHAGQPLVYFTRVSKYPTAEYLEEFRQNYVGSICRMMRAHQVYVLRPFPEMHEPVPQALGRALLKGRSGEDVVISKEDYRRRNDFVWQIQDQAAEQCGARILDPTLFLCDENFCYGSRGGKPLYVDDDHLSESGNRLLVPLFEQVFKPALQGDATK